MLRTSLAIGAGKLTASLVSWFRLGAGTSLPGKVARKIDPHLLAALGTQIREQTIAVTGTNGKTTTCGLLTQFLEESGKKVVHNQLGANMLPGITAAILRQSSLGGHLNAEYGVLEVDEASLRGVTAEMPADIVMVTNLFRDQLDRYGELDTTSKMIQAGISPKTKTVILNADDPLVSSLALRLNPDQRPLYFGIDTIEYAHGQAPECPVVFPREVTDCPSCQKTLRYDATIYGHLGHYRCDSCQYERPEPMVLARKVTVSPNGSEIFLELGEKTEIVSLSLPGLFNVYNFLAALAVVYHLGLPISSVQQGLRHYQSVFGRAEKKKIQGKSVMVMLIKNPVGASEVLKLVGGDPKGRLMVALNDNYADGRDVSWIWDAMFEVLADTDKPIVVSGVRAEDMAVRLKYAGVRPELLVVESDLEKAMHTAITDTATDETLYVLPTYTALLAMRKLLNHI